MTERLWTWSSGALESHDTAPAGPLAVADSWLVENGRSRALDRHRLRFLSSALSVDSSVSEREAMSFWNAAVSRLPTDGAWFPRVELWRSHSDPDRPQRRGDPAPASTLALRLRPAPPRTDSVVLASAPSDPRLVPSLKGPDIPALLALRAEAMSRGADESVLLSPEGHIIDGTTSALFWWSDGALYEPPLTLARVDSVTAQLLRVIAGVTRTRLHRELATPDELDGLEVWTVNALHGLRPVTGWIGGPHTAPPSARVAEWRALLHDPRYSS